MVSFNFAPDDAEPLGGDFDNLCPLGIVVGGFEVVDNHVSEIWGFKVADDSLTQL